jgi:4-amino-4-deoxychorismate lyase
MLECLVNGEISSFLPASNRGLNYGDGLFETMVVNHGHPRWWQAHMDRLGIGCERLGMNMPQQAVLLREVKTASAGLTSAVVKIVLTRQGQARGYGFDINSGCDRIISAHAMPKGLKEPVLQGSWARTCNLRLAIQPALGGVKHLNRLEQVLATAEKFDEGVQEGIMLDWEENVISAISANLFIVMGQRLLTPRLDRCGIRGVVRGQILAAFKSRCEQRRIQPDLLREAHEVFICNSVKGIVPITRVDAQNYEIGPVTRELQSWYQECERQ